MVYDELRLSVCQNLEKRASIKSVGPLVVVDHEIVKGWSGSYYAPHRSLGYPRYWASFVISTLCTKDLLPISKMSSIDFTESSSGYGRKPRYLGR